MRVISTIDFSILDNGKYQLNEAIAYTSPRYGKTAIVPAGYVSDGATGAMDIASRAWFVHDILCERGFWDDGTPLTNWQCSTVLYDILSEEGRKWQAVRWRYATLLFGGGKARKNGIFSLKSEA